MMTFISKRLRECLRSCLSEATKTPPLTLRPDLDIGNWDTESVNERVRDGKNWGIQDVISEIR